MKSYLQEKILAFFSSLYHKQARPMDELLSMVGLENDADKRLTIVLIVMLFRGTYRCVCKMWQTAGGVKL